MPVADLVLTGTAATGHALAGATVDAKCATGAGSTTTATDGSFTITIAGGVLPCVLRVTSGAVVLHSVAATTGQSARADLTPVTELVVARLAGDVPSAYYAAFGGAGAASPTSTAAQAATLSAIDTLRTGGVDFSALGVGVLTGPLVAANGSIAGDGYDQRLDALGRAITATGVTIAQLAQAFALSSPAAATATRSAVASLPPELLLAPAAPNCASLRSGRYRIVVNEDGGAAPLTGVVTVNAPALTLMNPTGGIQQLVATGPCTYSNADGGEVFVNRAGIAISRVDNSTPALRAAVMFPEQDHAVADLAGDYNTMAFDGTPTAGSNHLTTSTLTLDATGKLTALNLCDDLRTCVASTAATLPNVTLTPNAGSGGFILANTTSSRIDRAFAYRAGGGELMIVGIANAGHITFMTRNVAATLPAVGRVQQFWNMFVNASYMTTGALSQSKSTVASVDAASDSYLRNQQLSLASTVTRPETFVINSLRPGYFHRLGPVVAQQSDGSLSNVVEFISLPLRGMDVTVLALIAANQLGIASLEF
ncbi:MAG: hypothetical protein ABI364_03845 [Caldimonas sp.]